MNRLGQSTVNDALVFKINSMSSQERGQYFYDNPTKASQIMIYFCEHKERLLKKKHVYFVTFTTRADTTAGSEEFLISQAERRGIECTDFIYTVEHPTTNLHYHTLIRTTKSIVKSDFKHWIDNRGNIDFKPVKDHTTIPDLLAYMSKESKIQTVKGSF